MLSITTDIAGLSQKQREALAGFILTFPPANMLNLDECVKVVENISKDISAGENIVSDIPSAEEAFGASIADDESKESWANKTSEQVKADIEFMLEPIATPTNPHLDKNGLPWDDRIHSGSRARNADGSWRYKRGVADTWVVEVEKELRALMAIPSPPIGPQVAPPIERALRMAKEGPVCIGPDGYVFPAAPSDNHPTAQENRPTLTPADVMINNSVFGKTVPPPFTSPSVPAIPPVPAVPAVPSPVPMASPVSSSPSVPPPPPPAASSEGPFVTLVKKVGALIPAGKLTQEEAKAACMAVGVNELYLLSNRHDLCPAVDAAIDAIVAGR